MRMIFWISTVGWLSLGACNGGNTTPGPLPTPTPTPVPTPTPTPGVGSITTTGGTISLPSVAEFRFPAGAFSTPTTVQISQIATSSLPEEFSFNTRAAYAQTLLSSAVLVRLGTEQPAMPTTATLTLPASYVSSKPANMAFAVLAGTVNSGSEESDYDTYELIDPLFDSATSSLSFSVPRYFFTQRDTAGAVVGRFVVVQVPGPQRTQ